MLKQYSPFCYTFLQQWRHCDSQAHRSRFPGKKARASCVTTRAKHLARLGQEHLQEAILDVLFHSYSVKGGLRPKQISLRAGIYRRSIDPGNPSHVMRGMLGRLVRAKKIEAVQEYPGSIMGWRLTAREYKRRSRG